MYTGPIKSGLFSNGRSLPYYPPLIEKAKELRKNMTPTERKIWYKFLRNQPIRVLRQRPIDFYIVDFYCPKAKLVIELDGISHLHIDQSISDAKRTRVLESYGLLVVRYENKQIRQSFDAVCQKIECIVQQRIAM